jgi:hypothetical protein
MMFTRESTRTGPAGDRGDVDVFTRRRIEGRSIVCVAGPAKMRVGAND